MVSGVNLDLCALYLSKHLLKHVNIVARDSVLCAVYLKLPAGMRGTR